MGQTVLFSCLIFFINLGAILFLPSLWMTGKPDGMRLGRVQGTYLYGILRSAKARVELLTSDQDREQFHSILAEETTEDSLDKFANHLQTCGLDYNALRKMVFAAESESAT